MSALSQAQKTETILKFLHLCDSRNPNILLATEVRPRIVRGICTALDTETCV